LIKDSNDSKVSDCPPSERAFFGSLCTSTMSPSAPTASPAFASGATRSYLPAAWLGSTMIGRWDSFFINATVLRSRVFRVDCSNVLIPLSHSTTFGFPSLRMYSAASRNSSIVADIPLLRRIGLPSFATFLRRSKLCMFLAPIWIMSVCFLKRSSWSVDVISLIVGMPTSFDILLMILRPSSSSP